MLMVALHYASWLARASTPMHLYALPVHALRHAIIISIIITVIIVIIIVTIIIIVIIIIVMIMIMIMTIMIIIEPAEREPRRAPKGDTCPPLRRQRWTLSCKMLCCHEFEEEQELEEEAE